MLTRALLYLVFVLAAVSAFSTRRALASHAFAFQPAANDVREDTRRADSELGEAEEAFDRARSAYDGGKIDRGDAALEDMTKALDACIASLNAAGKSRLYKKAELRVATLQRRLSALLDDIALPDRGWAEQTSRKLEEIHDKLLAGVMRK